MNKNTIIESTGLSIFCETLFNIFREDSKNLLDSDWQKISSFLLGLTPSEKVGFETKLLNHLNTEKSILVSLLANTSNGYSKGNVKKLFLETKEFCISFQIDLEKTRLSSIKD